MAIIFGFCVECGPDKEQCVLIQHYYSQLSFDLFTGTHCEIVSSLRQDDNQNWWCEMYSPNLSSHGVRTVKDATEFSEVALRLYQRLLTAPDFRFAMAGIEVDGIWSFSEFRHYIEKYEDGSKYLRFKGLVVRKDIWQELGNPSSLWRHFREGYIWQGYYGQDYSPVGSADGFGTELGLLAREIGTY